MRDFIIRHNIKQISIYSLLMIVALLQLSSTMAQEVEIGGELTSVFGVQLDNDKSIVGITALDLDFTSEIGDGFFPIAILYANLRSEFDSDFSIELGEAYAKLFIEDVDLIIGQQNVSWGSTDGLNPVDVFNPQDLSRGLLGARKLPMPMIRAIYNAPSGMKLDALVSPTFKATKLPEIDAPLPTGFPEGIQVVGVEPTLEVLPETSFENVQFGVRATLPVDILDGGDVSLSYAHAIDTDPTVSINLIPVSADTPQNVKLQPQMNYTSYDLIGFDFSVAALGTVFRGEAAYRFTTDGDGTDMTVANHSLQGVFGSEYTFDNDLMVGLQGVVDYVAADQDMDADIDFSSMLSLNYTIDNRTSLSGIWFQNITDGSGAVLPSFDYTFADGITGTVAVAFLYGDDGSQFGTLRDTSAVTVGLSYAF